MSVSTFNPCPECRGAGCEQCDFKGSARAWAERRTRYEAGIENGTLYGQDPGDENP